MIINSINIINLERRTDLEIAQRAVWEAAGAPREKVVFHDAIDGTHYENREQLIEDARNSGIEFFKDVPDDAYEGVGELACLWSITRLLHSIVETKLEDQVFLYVLADRFSKKRYPYLLKLFSRLEDFMLLQFKGHVPYWDTIEDRDAIKENYTRKYVPGDDVIPENTIEIGNTKLGDGVMAMTPEGAWWMLETIEKYAFPTPYENMLWFEGLGRKSCPPGVYSTPCADYDYSDASTLWEGEFPPPLSGWHSSDIGEANRLSETGDYQNPNEALNQEWFAEKE